jgi:hypothetical protein
MGSVLDYFATDLLALAFFAGCVDMDTNLPTEGASNSPRSGGKVNSESKLEASKSPNHTDAPNIGHRPGA